LKPALGLLTVALLVAYLSEGVLRVEANRWKLLRLLFYIQQERFGLWEIAALRKQLSFQEVAELYVKGASLSLGKKSGLIYVFLCPFEMWTVQE
jgi:predicted membrane channel-forming protein YqfA (hemolysin III family)